MKKEKYTPKLWLEALNELIDYMEQTSKKVEKESYRYIGRDQAKAKAARSIENMRKAIAKDEKKQRGDILHESVAKRRAEAVAATMERYIARYKDLPEIADLTPEEMSLQMNANAEQQTYEQSEILYDIYTAAAVWIYDELQKTKSDEYKKLLDRVPCNVDFVRKEVLIDLDKEYLNKIIYILCRKDNTPKGKTPTLLNAVTAKRTNRPLPKTDTESDRLTFDDCYNLLVSMLPREDVLKVHNDAHKLFWMASDVAAHEIIHNRQMLLTDVANLKEDIRRIRKIRSDCLPPEDRKDNIPLLVLNESRGFQDTCFNGKIENDNQRLTNQRVEALRIGADMMERTKELEENLDAINYLYFRGCVLDYDTNILENDACEKSEETLESWNLLKEYAALNMTPYAFFFALLDMIECGEDIAWCVGPNHILLSYFGKMLPWVMLQNVYSKTEREQTERKKIDILAEGYPFFNERDLPMMVVAEDNSHIAVADWQVGKTNLTQFVYSFTDVVLPRRFAVDKELAEVLAANSDLTEKEAALITQIISVCVYMRQQKELHETEVEELRAELEEERSCGSVEKEAENEQLRKEKEAAMRENEELKRQLEQIKSELRAAEEKNAELQDRLAAETARADENMNELCDLRELAYNLSLDSDEKLQAERLEQKIQYPVHLDKRIVICGGHETWVNPLKQMITGDIRYLDRYQTITRSALINADEIWIQNNCLSHANFWTCAETARKEKIPLRYFSFASAEKCVEQMLRKRNATENC